MYMLASARRCVSPQEVTHSFIPTADHRTLDRCKIISHERGTMITYHTQTHSLITIHQITEILAGSSDGDPLLIPQLMKSALNSKIRLPILTIRYSKQRYVKPALETSRMNEKKNSPAPPAIVPSR